MSETDFRSCVNERCRWHGLQAECFTPRNMPKQLLCPECGSPTNTPEQVSYPKEPQFSVSGFGFTGPVDCLRKAVEIVKNRKNGAIYQKFLEYGDAILSSKNMTDEMICDCSTCNGTPLGKALKRN